MAIQVKQFTPTSHKIKALVYGAAGSGKTSFGGTAKNAIFASAEGGLLSIADKRPNYVDIKSLGDLKELHQYLKTQKHEFDTVVIDSITEINEIIKLDIEKRVGRAMQLQDWGTLAKEIRNILRSFRDLPMHVLFIAQETTDDKDESGVAAKIVPALNGKAATEIAYFMDIVGYISINKIGEHKVMTAPHARYLTKDRSRTVGNDAPADFAEWVKRVETIQTGEEKVVQDYTATPPSAPAPKKLTLFETTMARVAELKTTEELKDAYEKVDIMTRLSAIERDIVRDRINERIEGMLESQESNDQPPF